VLCATVVAGCAPDRKQPELGVSITADTTRGIANTSVMLGGFTRSELRSLGSELRENDREGWQRAFRVSVAGDTAPIVGRYSVTDTSLQFQPAFPFDRERDYDVVIRPKQLATRRRDTQVEGRFRLPGRGLKPTTRVTRIYPTADTLPENQLRIYVEFSAPMSREGGLPYVHLLDADGNEVKAAFLPLDADFWNRERTRYTLFLDPGRVKRGILPNEQMGRALLRRKRYSIVVDSTWRDGDGQPLVASHVKRFRAGAADYQPISLAAWRIDAPRAGTRDPLIIRFNEALDRGLLGRALGVEHAEGSAVDGETLTAVDETEWRFVPAQPWLAGSGRIVVLDILEDLAGNRVNRAFEVDMFQRADTTAAPSRFTIPFRVR
jgi:hypothetical protein